MGRSDSIDKIGGLNGSCQTSDIGTHRGLSLLDETSQKNFKFDKLASHSLIEDSRQGVVGGGTSNKKASSLMMPLYEE